MALDEFVVLILFPIDDDCRADLSVPGSFDDKIVVPVRIEIEF